MIKQSKFKQTEIYLKSKFLYGWRSVRNSQKSVNPFTGDALGNKTADLSVGRLSYNVLLRTAHAKAVDNKT